MDSHSVETPFNTLPSLYPNEWAGGKKLENDAGETAEEKGLITFHI